jgi:cyclic-di-GMP phosphodiesterase, flagellum assembly factor TipF
MISPLGIVAILLVSVCLVVAAVLLRLWRHGDDLAQRFFRLRQELRDQEDRQRFLQTELRTAKENDQKILALLGDLAKASKQAARAEIEAVAAEVRVLQNLVQQLTQSRAIGGGVVTSISRGGRANEATPQGPPPAIRSDYGPAKILDVVRDALATERIDLYVQPIVSLPQRKIRHFECLSRIRDEDGGIILPDQYVPIAEAEGLMAAIDNMLLFRCIQLIRRAHITNFHGSFFCNLSKHTLHDAAFFDDFLGFLQENRELASRLVFEISQADFDARDSNREKLLKRLVDAGCRLALAGVTNPRTIDMTALDQAKIKFVKIEIQVLLEKLRQAPVLDLQIYRRVLDNYNVDLIVERIESEDHLLELLDYDIDFGQGYLFGEPKLSKLAA